MSFCHILALILLAATIDRTTGSSIKAANNRQVDDATRVLRRQKRKFLNHDTYPERKWPTQIPYYLDPKLTTEQKGYIKQSMQEDFESVTCLRFTELNSATDTKEHFMHFVKSQESECAAYIGKINITEYTPSVPILLGPTCFSKKEDIRFGITRTLGTVFEIERYDRDGFVKIEWDNLALPDGDELLVYSESVAFYRNVPYDYGSSMHHSAQAWLKPLLKQKYPFPDISNPESYSIRPKDGKLLRVLGQRSEVSFFDIMAINQAYCSTVCAFSLTCSNGGYQDPNDCTKCLCPDGLAGTRCDELDEHVDNGLYHCTPNSGIIAVSEEVQCVSSPGYGTRGYTTGDKCSWLLKAGSSHTMDLWFKTDLSIANTDVTCDHWVEIKYKGVDSTRGPRYCSVDPGIDDTSLPRSSSKLTSESSDVLVIFKSPQAYFTPKTDSSKNGGFELCFALHIPPVPDKDEGSKFPTMIVVAVVIVVMLVGTLVIVAVLLVRRQKRNNTANETTGGVINPTYDNTNVHDDGYEHLKTLNAKKNFAKNNKEERNTNEMTNTTTAPRTEKSFIGKMKKPEPAPTHIGTGPPSEEDDPHRFAICKT